MKILITGANGFIGSALVSHLSKNKKNVIYCLYQTIKPNIKNANNIKFYKIDLTTIKIEKKIKIKFNIILHLANYDTYFTKKNLNDILLKNILIHKNVISYASKSKAKIIFFSSSEVSQKKLKGKSFENENFVISSHNNPRIPYMISKFAGEYILHSLFQNHKKNFLIIRLSNVYGPGMSIGQVVSDLIIKVHKQNKIVLHNSKSKRNFIFIADLVLIIDKLIKNWPKENIINISSDEVVSIKTLLNYLLRIFNKKIKIYERNQKNILNKILDTSIMKKNNLNCNTTLINGLRLTKENVLKRYAKYQKM